jgi:hypothetical protein
MRAYMKRNTIIIGALFLFSLFLVTIIFQKIDSLPLSGGDSIVECLTGSGNEDLPLTTPPYESCQNVCGPMARCTQTGDQCVRDSDCPMCPPPIPENSNRVSVREEVSSEFVVGDNDAGKSVGMIPKQSSLTASYPSDASLFAIKNPIKMGNLLGINTWANKFNDGMTYFRKRYEEPSKVYYLPRVTLSGEFPDDGPFAANA